MKKIGWCLGFCLFFHNAVAQVADDFSDNDFVANPTWAGHEEKFEVATERLHLNDVSATGEAFLSTPSEAIANAEWHFYTEITENPSASNYAVVYLTSDQADLSGDLHGYFVKIGGANDEVSLFRQDGSAKTVIIDGIDARVDMKPVQIDVKVTRDASGNWQLSSKVVGDADFTVEGSALDNTHQTSTYFGVYCKYTSTRKDAFYFDDISVSGTSQPDTQQPEVTNISVLSDTQLSIQFSETITVTTAEDPANYMLTGHTISSAILAGNSVTLTVQPALENAMDYSLIVSNIADEAGNTLADTTLTFFYFEAIPAQWNSVVISELMPDPNPVKENLPDAEYLELYNRSEHPFDLQDWTINGKPLPNFIIRPQQYLIVCASADSSLFAPWGDVLPLSTWPSLSNSGSSLVLKDASQTAIDSLTYSGDQVAGGIALERVREETPCDQRINLALSLAVQGGTPGEANTVTNNEPDTEAPQLLQVKVVNSQKLQLIFDERVSDASLQASSVSLEPGRAVSSLVRDTIDEKMVWVTLEEELQSGATYTITFLNAEDCYGNGQTSQNQSFYFDDQPPVLSQVIVRDTSVLQLVFSEQVAAVEKSQFWADSVGNTPKSVKLLEDSASAVLEFQSSFADGKEHLITIHALQDVYGNTADSLTATFRYAQDIDTVVVVSEYQVDVYLKREVATGSATVTENFEIDRGVGQPYKSFVDKNQADLVHWVLAKPLAANREHELSISQLYDVEQNLLSTPIYRFYYDQRPPTLDSVVAVNAKSLLLYFDEVLDVTSASNPLHYTLEPDSSKIIQAYLQENKRVVQLTLETDLVPEVEYELQVLGIADISGNVISIPKSRIFVYDQHPPKLVRWKIINPHQLRLYFSEAIRLGKPADFILEDFGAPDSISFAVIHPYEVRLFFSNPLLFDTATLIIHQVSDRRGNGLSEDISVSLANAEITLGSISVLSPTELRLDFTQAISKEAMLTPSKYQINQQFHPSKVSAVAEEPYAVHLITAQPFQTDATYQLAIDQIVSAQGQSSTGVQGSFHYQTQVDYLETETQAVLIHFQVPVDSSEAVNIAHYQLENNEPVAALWVDAQTIRLVFAQAFAPLTRYNLSLSGLLTIDQDLIPASVYAIGLGRTPTFNELLITEIMADPSPFVGLPEAEYLEFYNASSDLLSTSGLRLSDASSSTLLPSTLLLPGEYLIVSSSTDQLLFAGQGRSIGVSSFPSLNSTGDQLRLEDAYGREIFSINYTDEWYNDAEKKQGGWSLEMIDLTRPCGERENWTASEAEAGGTPGKENSVHQPNPDMLAPFLSEAFAVSDTVVRVTFSEKIDMSSLGQAQFNLSSGIRIDTVLWQDDRKSAQLLLSNPLQTGETYTVQAARLSDCSGNTLDSKPVSFVLSETAEIGDVLLSELLVYPRAGGVRFVEIYNHSDRHINLKDWQLANLEGDSLVNLTLISIDDYQLAPQQYLALTEDIITLIGDYPSSLEENLLTVNDLPSLPSEAGTLVLVSPDGERMQVLEYNEQFHHPILDDARGVSLERIRWEASVNDANNWQSAASTAGYATPGYANSQTTQAKVSQENLSVEPRVFTPDQDGWQDYTQIHYQWTGAGYVANVIIFDSQGRKVKHLARNATLAEEGFLRWDGTDDNRQIVRMGYYLIYFEVFHTNGRVSVLKERVVVGKRFDN
uniref:Lamin tail domain-containing protein n=1 Tax=Roseihalotalea indica TaxID=2867963 RepID=A0AA49GPZ0_9BACT|nr:lamin tail domain-containing protein [Tunicatimonas sp. TK19036]